MFDIIGGSLIIESGIYELNSSLATGCNGFVQVKQTSNYDGELVIKGGVVNVNYSQDASCRLISAVKTSKGKKIRISINGGLLTLNRSVRETTNKTTSAILLSSNTDFVMSAGTINITGTVKDATGIYMAENASAIIEDGRINIPVSESSYGIMNTGTGTATISGGTFMCKKMKSGSDIGDVVATGTYTYQMPIEENLDVGTIVVIKKGTETIGPGLVQEDNGIKYVEIKTEQVENYTYENNSPIPITQLDCFATLSLQENINVNFYVKPTLQQGATLDPSKIKIECKANTHEVENKAFDLSDTKEVKQISEGDYDGYYRFVAETAAAAEMTVPVNVKIYYCENDQKYLLKEVDYSVQQYCENTIRKNQNSLNKKDQNLVALCKATLDYGAFAQRYFPVDNKNKLANEKYGFYTNETEISGEAIPNTYRASMSGSITGVKPSVSLDLLSDTSIIVYFLGAKEGDLQLMNIEPNANASFTFDSTNNVCVLKIKDIVCCDLDEMYSVTLKKTNSESETMTLTFSALSYAYSYQSKGNGLGDLCKALYLYNKAADAYFTQSIVEAK